MEGLVKLERILQLIVYCVLSHSAESDSLQSHGLDFPNKSTRVGCHFLLQETFPTQESNSCLLPLLHWQADFFATAPPGKP